jgi:probable rRNA maturation factor
VQYASAIPGLPSPAQFRIWARAALFADAQIAIRVVNEAEGRRINQTYRGKRSATNVLSFEYGAAPAAPKAGGFCGDLVLCAQVIAREARAQGKPLAAHYAHLTVHGMLHLQGYDHQREHDANKMERLETAILRRLGFADPYLT